mmetsp:Transcript_1153/g.3361  ORF Transcript_1153/g.3361 Transcript_1153/m.3361 type:complete len:85 (-) Transcript_1153:210-464(-)
MVPINKKWGWCSVLDIKSMVSCDAHCRSSNTITSGHSFDDIVVKNWVNVYWNLLHDDVSEEGSCRASCRWLVEMEAVASSASLL